MEQFYKQLNIPNNCEVNNTIFKKAFLDNADLTSSDKKIINDHIKKVTWKYCLKPETINILPYKDDKRDYLEIEIIEVQLNEISKVNRIAEIIMRAIPYPILLILVDNDKLKLAVGDMRKNLSDSSKVTVEDFVFTDWIDTNSADVYSEKLFAGLNISTLDSSNYYAMYQDITSKLNVYNFSKVKGKDISKSEGMSNSDIKACYDKIKSIEVEISALKSKVKKAGSIKEKVELNIQIDKLKKEVDDIKSKI